MKRHVRSAVDQVARLSGVLARRERDAARGVTVLTYHRVLSEERCARYPFPSLAMPLGAFREQIRWLTSQGDVLPLRAALENCSRSERPVFAVTFDDGYVDSRENIAAVLDEFGVHGTFFVTTGFVAARRHMWFDRAVLLFDVVDDRTRRAVVADNCGADVVDHLPPRRSSAVAWTHVLKSCGREQQERVLTSLEWIVGGAPSLDGFEPMTQGDVVDLHRAGHEIGSHTISHPILTALDDAELRSEIDGAHGAIREWLGVPAQGFCFPNGDHDDRVVRAVENAGHTYACTTRDGIHPRSGDPFRIARVDIVRDRVTKPSRRLDLTGFRRELCGLYRHRARTA